MTNRLRFYTMEYCSLADYTRWTTYLVVQEGVERKVFHAARRATWEAIDRETALWFLVSWIKEKM